MRRCLSRSSGAMGYGINSANSTDGLDSVRVLATLLHNRAVVVQIQGMDFDWIKQSTQSLLVVVL